MKIKNLAMKGGGVKGIAYVGALKELHKLGHFDTIERVSGTSAGALVALMVALQLSPTQIETLMNHLDFNKFKRGCNPLRIFTKYGLFSGDEILKFVDKCFEASSLNIDGKKLDRKSTFADLEKAHGKELIAFASNLNTLSMEEFSAFKTPDCIVAEAVRASMSIPLFFKSWQFTNSIPNDHIYVDGGVVFNYPLSFFDKPRFNENPDRINMETIGLFLEPKRVYEDFIGAPGESEGPREMRSGSTTSTLKKIRKEIYEHTFKYGMIITKYLRHLFDTLMHSQDIELFEESHLVMRTIFIDDLGIPATKFNLSKEDKQNLIDSGVQGVHHYLNYLESKKNPPSTESN